MIYRLIALDVDGTLLNDDHVLTPRVRESVRAAARSGAEIVLCTGRGSASALSVLDELGLSGTMITHNGASIVDSATRGVLFEQAIDHRLAQRYIDELRKRDLHFDMNTSFELFVNQLDEQASRMYADMYVHPILRPIEDGLPKHTVKLSVYGPAADIDAVEDAWRNEEHELQYIRSGIHFIDIQHSDAAKGKSLEKLAAIRGIPREQVLAIGNYYNDIGMLEFAGLGIAMDNSPDGVRAKADDTALSNNENGVAHVLERLILA